MAEPRISVEIEATLDKLDTALASALTRVQASTQTMSKLSAVPLFGSAGVITSNLDAGLAEAEAKVQRSVANMAGQWAASGGLFGTNPAAAAAERLAKASTFSPRIDLMVYDQELRKVEAHTAEATKRIQAASSGIGADDWMLPAFGKGIIGVKGVEGAIKLVTAAAHLARGESDALAETLGSLPLIGGTIRAATDLGNVLSGAADEAARLAENAERAEKMFEGTRALRGESEAREAVVKFGSEDASLRTRQQELRDEAERLRRDIGRTEENLRLSPSLSEGQRSRIGASVGRQQDRLQQTERLEALITEELASNLRAREAAMDKSAAELVTKHKATAAELVGIQAENYAIQLEKEGNFLGARIARIEADYNERIRLANAEGRGWEAAELETQKQPKIVEVRVEAVAGVDASLDSIFGNIERQVAEHERDLRAIETENQAVALELEGRSLEARQLRLAASYEERIRTAREAGNEEAAVALENQQRLKEAEVKLAGEREVLSVEAENRALALEAQGRGEDARTARLEASYAERIDLARKAGDEELAIALETQRDLRLADADRVRTTDPRSFGASEFVEERMAANIAPRTEAASRDLAVIERFEAAADRRVNRVDEALAKMFRFEAEVDKQSRGVEPDLAGKRDEALAPPKVERNPQLDESNKFLAEIVKNTKNLKSGEMVFA